MDDAWRRRWGDTPPILTLLDLLAEHRGAFEYDWRTRFQLSVRVIGTKAMTYGEAWRQTFILMGDPSSQIAAALGGWDHPVDRADLVLRDLYDLQHAKAMAGSKKNAKPYPRPWPEVKTRRQAPGADVTQEQIFEALRSAGHGVAQARARDARGRFVKRG
jgi:hypothetical protein